MSKSQAIPVKERKIQQSNSNYPIYDIVIIGGGPSTISYICSLYQESLESKVFPYTKILIIEQTSNFGSGCLGKFGIRSNTTADGFLRLLYKNKKKSLIDTKPSKISSNTDCFLPKIRKNQRETSKKESFFLNFEGKDNSTKENTLNEGFLDFYNSESCLSIRKLKSDFVSLSCLGEYLNELGKYLIDLIKRKYNFQLVKFNCKAKEIRKINKEYKILIENLISKEIITIKSKKIILANGCLPKKLNLLPEFNSTTDRNRILILSSDEFLVENGYIRLLNHIYNHITTNKNKDHKLRLVIIGGSHSGFSSLWMLLNGPSLCGNSHEKSSIEHCLSWKIYKSHEIFSKLRLEVTDLYKYIDITLYSRSEIKVSYSSIDEAIADEYSCFSRKCMNSKGKIYPFVGIRADAKELYRKIMKKNEERVKICVYKSEVSKEYKEMITKVQSSDIIIYAYGYVTNKIPISSIINKPNINDTTIQTMSSVSSRLEVYSTDNTSVVYENIYGIGQGYGINAPEIVDGKRIRADSIYLYNSVTSKKLNKTLLSLYKINEEEYKKKERKEKDKYNIKENEYKNIRKL